MTSDVGTICKEWTWACVTMMAVLLYTSLQRRDISSVLPSFLMFARWRERQKTGEGVV